MPDLGEQPVAVRHPLDPDPARSTKATVVLVLGITAAVTGLFVGGVVPASLALMLAAEAKREHVDAAGFLTGRRPLRAGITLAWLGLVLAVTAVVIASIMGLLQVADHVGDRDYPPTVN